MQCYIRKALPDFMQHIKHTSMRVNLHSTAFSGVIPSLNLSTAKPFLAKMSSYGSAKAALQGLRNFADFKIASGLEICAGVLDEEGQVTARLLTNFQGQGLILHWGVGKPRSTDWLNPMTEGYALPTGTVTHDSKAARTPFCPCNSAYQELTLHFPTDKLPIQINFVVNQGSTWYNNSGRNYALRLQEQPHLPALSEVAQEMAQDILNVEGGNNSWTLMHRFNKCREWLERSDLGQVEIAAWIYVWMRFSATRQLTWQRNYNTRPSELAWAQKQLTFALAGKVANASKFGLISPAALLRPVLGSIGKGGDNGQRIRDQILEIFHRHKIPETNNHFYEQWHQKLHNNTTPDDVGICEAAIAYNETRDMSRYWDTLRARGIDRARLETFERPIRAEPHYLPHIINDLKDYLRLLKSVHTGDDLLMLIGNAQSFLSDELKRKLNEIAQNFYHFDAIVQMGRVTHVRHVLSSYRTSDSNALREVMYLDIALEGYVRQLSEKVAGVNIELKYRVQELTMVLDNYRRFANDEELNKSFDDWMAFSGQYGESAERNPQHALVLKSVADRLVRTLGRYTDQMSGLLQPKADLMAISCSSISESARAIFAEEAIRGSVLFSASSTLRKIDRFLRSFAHLNPWQVISPGKLIEGTLQSVPNLHDIQLTRFPQPTILVVNQVGGEEDIPEGVKGVISMTELDTLAHVSVRARNLNVFLAVCHEEEAVGNIRRLEGHLIRVACDRSGDVKIQEIREITSGSETVKAVTVVRRPLESREAVLDFERFEEGRTGAKGNNCKAMREKLPGWIGVPRSVALPFGTCERVLADPANASHLATIEEAYSRIEAATDPKVGLQLLPRLKQTISALACPALIAEEVKTGLHTLGWNPDQYTKAWETIKRVWASKYNERAYVSTLKAGISLRDISMSVLCQEVISGEYAFVLHTTNPVTGNAHEVYGEVVVGLGETLVGAYPGRALAFTADKNSSQFEVISYPNKSIALEGSGYIFRSDSNSEDLEGFAGAGLFDSYLQQEPASKVVQYSSSRLFEEGHRAWLIGRLKEVAVAVETAFEGVAQDIEGVVVGDRVVVVQSRPQV